jgi:hypothetical protein
MLLGSGGGAVAGFYGGRLADNVIGDKTPWAEKKEDDDWSNREFGGAILGGIAGRHLGRGVAEMMPKGAASDQIEKEALFGLGKKQPMYKRPAGLNRAQARRAQQMRNIESEYARKGAFHPGGPVMANRGGLGTNEAAINRGKQDVAARKQMNRTLYPQGHNPDISMQYRKGGQLQGTYPSLSGKVVSHPPIQPAAPTRAVASRDVGADYMSNTGQFAPEAQYNPPAAPAPSQAPAPAPAPTDRYQAARQADAARGTSLADQAMNSRNAMVKRLASMRMSKPQRTRLMSKADKRMAAPSVTPQQRADTYRQADQGTQAMQALSSAGYSPETVQRIMSQAMTRFGKDPSADRSAAFDKIIAYAKNNPRKAG